MECSRCSASLPPENDFVSCHGCKKNFDYVCAGVRESTWRKYSAETKTSWRCVICKTKTSGDNAKLDQGNSLPIRAQGQERSKNTHELNQSEPSSDVGGFDEVGYLKELLRHKDMVIDGQADLIRSLKEQILLLKREASMSAEVTQCSRKPSDKKVSKQPLHDGLSNKSAPREKPEDKSQHEAVAKAKLSSIFQGRLGDNGGDSGVGVTRLDVHEAVAKAKLDNIINLTNDTEDKDGKEWKAVGSRRRRRTIIGERPNDNSSKLRAVEAFSHWHVYRLHPDTVPEDVTNYLKNDFPGVRVEGLKSANPDVYASFKVSVRERDGSRILDAGLWPSGARVNRFFLPKNK